MELVGTFRHIAKGILRYIQTKNRSKNLVDNLLKMVYFELKYYSNSQHSSTTLNGFNSKRAFSLAIAPLRLQKNKILRRRKTSLLNCFLTPVAASTPPTSLISLMQLMNLLAWGPILPLVSMMNGWSEKSNYQCDGSSYFLRLREYNKKA